MQLDYGDIPVITSEITLEMISAVMSEVIKLPQNAARWKRDTCTDEIAYCCKWTDGQVADQEMLKTIVIYKVTCS